MDSINCPKPLAEIALPCVYMYLQAYGLAVLMFHNLVIILSFPIQFLSEIKQRKKVKEKDITSKKEREIEMERE